MADKTISDLDAAAGLDGTEVVELEQDGDSVQCTAQDIADLATGGGTPESGAGSPEGAVTAVVGTTYWQIDVGQWVKNTGAGNTGWVQHTSIV